jgi:ATP-binding cassette subfamily B protein
LALLLAGSTAMQVAGPQFLRRFVDGVGAGQPMSTLLTLGGLFVAFAVVAQVLWVAAEYVGSRVAWAATNDLRVDLLGHCLSLDLRFYQQHSPGELIERIDGDVGKLANYYSRTFLLMLVNLLLVLGIGVVLIWQDWRVGTVYVVFIIGSVLLLRQLVGRAVPDLVAQRAADAKQLGYVEERLSGLEDVRGAGAADDAMRGFWLRAREVYRASRRAATVGVRWPAAAEILSATGYALSLAAGAALFLTDQITLGAVFALAAYLAMIRIPLFIITTQFKDIEDALSAMRRVRELSGERSAIVDGHRVRASGPPEVSFHQVTFGYRPDHPAVREVSLTVPPGQRLGIVGATGSGKTTLIRLLFRLTDPQAGAVRFDGVDIRDFTLDSLRAQIGLVTQEVQVFHGTVRDNVTLFDDTVPDDRVNRALLDVGLDTWLATLPDGLDTILGSGASGLSGGQEQLLAFARAILADPGLVLLDEASSRLDLATQHALATAMERLLDGRTAVIVAHKLETLRTVDQILVLDDGRVHECGPPDQLLATPGSRYATMLSVGEVPA